MAELKVDTFCHSWIICLHVYSREKHCVDRMDHSKHLIGSTWTNRRCDRCTCSPGLLIDGPSDLTKGCIVKYNYDTCTFKVFNPKDPSVKCDYSVVGK
ncbi:small serum protein 2-like [Labeo rohita]|uniref:small serum protein 2-like n=1 Tax=Labeo rohita TaxID=84645 RepID=UPI0021E32825|nr:small serum protein 2-like [Labeo rohita]